MFGSALTLVCLCQVALMAEAAVCDNGFWLKGDEQVFAGKGSIVRDLKLGRLSQVAAILHRSCSCSCCTVSLTALVAGVTGVSAVADRK